jgi:TolB-like protein
MSKTHALKRAAFLSLFVTLVATAASAQQSDQPTSQQAAESEQLPRVGIIPFDATDSGSNLASVASSLTDFLTIDFKISGRVVVKSLKRPAADDFASSIGQILTDNKLDYLLFGTVKGNADGAIDIVAFLAGSQGERLSAGYRKLGSLFELSDAGDALYTSLAKNLGTVHKGFGRIEFSRDGAGDYDVYLNGEFAGHNIERIDNVMEGKQFVEIRQKRPFGVFTPVSESLTVAEGERVSVRFTLPAVLPQELAKVTDTVNMIDEKWAKADAKDEIESDIGSLEEAFSDISSCPGVGDLFAKTKQYRALWECRKLRFDIESDPLKFDPGRLSELEHVYASAAACPDPEAIRTLVREDVAVAESIRLAKATVKAAEGDFRHALDEYRAMAEHYRVYDMNLPVAVGDDVRLLEAIEALYDSAKRPGRDFTALSQAAVASGIGLVGISAGSILLDIPGAINDIPNSDNFALNISKGVGRSALLALEKVGVAGGAGLIAVGKAGLYRANDEEARDAGEAMKAHYGQRLGDADAFLKAASLPPPSKSRLILLSSEPGGLVSLNGGKPRPTPFVEDSIAAGQSVATGEGKDSVVVEKRTKIVFTTSARERIQAQSVTAEADQGGDLLKGKVSLSWEGSQDARFYRVIALSKTSESSDPTIRVFDRVQGGGFAYLSGIPDRVLSFAVYAVDTGGYASPVGWADASSERSMPFLSDHSRPLFFGGAIGGTFSTTEMSAGGDDYSAFRIEPSALVNLVPDSLMFGCALRFDISKSGLPDWGVFPLAVTGNVDSDGFQLYSAGLSSDGSKCTIDLGYGEGRQRVFFMPSVELQAESASPVRSFGFVVGRLF